MSIYTPEFITDAFLAQTEKDGRLLEAIELLSKMSDDEINKLPRMPKLSSWECALEEAIDTDHDQPYYVRFINELIKRGYAVDDIKKMRMIGWKTAGWYNFEMMAWDWCSLDERDMVLGLKDRLEKKNISQDEYDVLLSDIKRYKEPPT